MVSETKMLKTLTMGLLGVMIVVGLVFIVAGQYKKTICEDIDGEVYSAGNCYTNSTLLLESQSEAFNQTGAVQDAIKLLVSFLAIIVLMLVVKLLMSASKSFTDE